MKNIIAILILFTSINALSHGEDKLGPNGGYVRMPGNFHTEVVPNQDDTIKVYVLDINFKNPTVDNAKVEAYFKKKKPLDCKPATDHFICNTKGFSLKKGKLTIIAERDGIKGAKAKYKLPFALFKADDDHGDHKGHKDHDDHKGHH